MTTTDPPTDQATDVGVIEPQQAWIDEAVRAHNDMQQQVSETNSTIRRRRECIQMALAMGATQQQVANALGISREQVSKLNSR